MENPPASAIAETPVRFPALDGFDLGGVMYVLPSPAPPACAALIACGGGIPATRYAHLARYLAKAGIPVLTFDYRGIGASRPARLKGFVATLEDWSEHDCGGAIALLRARYGASALVGIAHSIGTFLLGAAPDAGLLSRLLFVGAHTAYYGDYHRRYRLPMTVLWHGVMPVLTRSFGYFPGRRLRLGEDIPRGVALHWAGRRTPDPKVNVPSAADPARTEAFFRRCASVRGRALALGFADDAFATAAGTARLLGEFPQIAATHVEIAPRQAGLKRIGHFGFFSRRAETALWPVALAWIRDGVVRRPG